MGVLDERASSLEDTLSKQLEKGLEDQAAALEDSLSKQLKISIDGSLTRLTSLEERTAAWEQRFLDGVRDCAASLGDRITLVEDASKDAARNQKQLKEELQQKSEEQRKLVSEQLASLNGDLSNSKGMLSTLER